MNDFYKETERLILRSPTKSDAQILAQKRSTEFVMRYNLYKPCDSKEIKEELTLFEHILLVSKNDASVIGSLSVKDDYLRYGVDSVSLQAWLTEDMSGQGYMAEALEVILEYLLVDRQHERISVQIFSVNKASVRLAEKLGFKQEGYLKRAVKNHKGQVFDVVLYSMDLSDYRNGRSSD